MKALRSANAVQSVSHRPEVPVEDGYSMNLLRTLVVFCGVAATMFTVDAAVANAYTTIDYGTNQGGCEAAEHEARAAGIRYADCFQTGPGHYSLAYDN
jgi:hypothetical protein